MRHRTFLLPTNEPKLSELLFHGDTSVIAHHALKERTALGIDCATFGEDSDEIQVVAYPAGIIVRVMCRCNFHGARAQVHIHQDIVCYNRNLPVGMEWMLDQFSDEVSVTRVLRVYLVMKSRSSVGICSV